LAISFSRQVSSNLSHIFAFANTCDGNATVKQTTAILHANCLIATPSHPEHPKAPLLDRRSPSGEARNAAQLPRPSTMLRVWGWIVPGNPSPVRGTGRPQTVPLPVPGRIWLRIIRQAISPRLAMRRHWIIAPLPDQWQRLVSRRETACRYIVVRLR
jgi:hypothetical protein